MPPRPLAPALAAAALCLPACTIVVLDRFPPYEPREASPLLVASQGRSSGEPRAFIPPRARPAPAPVASATGPICPSETPVRLHREVKRKKLPTPTPPDLPVRWKNEPARWKDLEIGAEMRLRYPPDIFAADKVSDGVRLVSALSVEAPHGADDPGADGRHWFRVSARVRPLPLLGAFCEVLPYMASVVFPGGRFEESVSAKKFAIAKREAYRVWAGIHGYDEQHIFVLLNEGSTLVLSFDSIGESLEHIVPKRVRGVAQKQEEIIQGLLESLRLPDRAILHPRSSATSNIPGVRVVSSHHGVFAGLLASLAACAPLTTTEKTTTTSTYARSLPPRRSPSRDFLLVEASLREAQVDLTLTWQRVCEVEKQQHSSTTTTTTTRADPVVLALEGIGTATLLGILASEKKPSALCARRENGDCQEISLLTWFSVVALVSSPPALLVDLLRQDTKTKHSTDFVSTPALVLCGQAPASKETVELMFPNGRRFFAVSGDEGKATLGLGKDGLELLQNHQHQAELWVGNKPVRWLRLAPTRQP